MPWNKEDYQDSLKNFTAPIRNKAIDIANALLEDGYEEESRSLLLPHKRKSGERIVISRSVKKDIN